MKLIFLLIFLLPFLAFSQLVKANYEHRDHTDASISRIQLLDSSAFFSSSGSAFVHGSIFEKGYYTQNKDTIILHYKPYNRPKPYFKVISKDTLKFDKWVKLDPSKRTSLSISLYENEKTPLRSLASLVDLISNNSIVATISIDEKGKFQFSTAETLIDELRIRSLGFKELKIPLSDFRGFTSQINAYLIPENLDYFRETEGEAKYLISKKGKYLQFIDEDGSLGVKYTKTENKK